MLLAAVLLLTGLTGCGPTDPVEESSAAGAESSAVSGDVDSSADTPEGSQPGADDSSEAVTDSSDAASNEDTQPPADDSDAESSAVTPGTNGNSGNTGNTGNSGNNATTGKPQSNTTTVKGQATTTTTKGGGTSVDSSNDFVLPTTGLNKKTVYVVEKQVLTAAPKGVMTHDAWRLMCSLQGLLNRDLEKNQIALYLTYDDTDNFWYNQMTASGGLLNGYKKVTISTFEEFLNTFAAQIKACGIVVWDPNVPATANVAATICGLDGMLPVKGLADDAGLLGILKDMGVKVKLNLCNRFKGTGIIPGTKIASTGSTKCDAYLWAMDKYMDRTSKKIIAYMPDGAGCIEGNPIHDKDNDATPYGNNLLDHDYLIAQKAFFFDLTPVSTEAPCDDLTQAVGTDHKTLRKILQRQYDRNNGAFSQIIGFPPWWIKYTDHNGWGSIPGTTVEWMFTDIVTQYNMAKEADAAHPCCMANASVYYHADLLSSFKNTNRKETVTEKFDKNTVYMLYYMGDYDSSAWLKKWVPVIWSDSKKGQMPMMWSFNPNLSDRMPLAFNYVYSNQDKMDYFVAGDSGPGYIIPGGLFQATCPERTNPDGGKAWSTYAKPYMQRFDMDIVGFIINGNYKMNTAIMKLYNELAPTGSFHNDPSKPLTIVDGVPYVYLKNGVGNPGSYTASAEGMYSYLKNQMKGLNFGAFRTICWTPSQIIALSDTFISYAKQKDPNTTYKFVDPYTFFAMIQQSGQGTKA